MLRIAEILRILAGLIRFAALHDASQRHNIKPNYCCVRSLRRVADDAAVRDAAPDVGVQTQIEQTVDVAVRHRQPHGDEDEPRRQVAERDADRHHVGEDGHLKEEEGGADHEHVPRRAQTAAADARRRQRGREGGGTAALHRRPLQLLHRRDAARRAHDRHHDAAVREQQHRRRHEQPDERDGGEVGQRTGVVERRAEHARLIVDQHSEVEDGQRREQRRAPAAADQRVAAAGRQQALVPEGGK